MKLSIQEQYFEYIDRPFWRWQCHCGVKGHWQDLSIRNAANGGKAHLRDRHNYVDA